MKTLYKIILRIILAPLLLVAILTGAILLTFLAIINPAEQITIKMHNGEEFTF